MLGQQLFVIFYLKRTVTVVRDILFLFADNFPVEPIEPTREGRDFVEAHHPGSGRRWCIATGVWQLAHPTLANEIYPSL
ncbi:hypothetical protein D3C85_1734320 [compost metagenome]